MSRAHEFDKMDVAFCYTYNIRPKEVGIQKKLTISIDEQVYNGLYASVGKRKIAHFIEDLVRPHVIHTGLDAAYQAMASDKKREQEADEWIEGTIGHIDAPR